jgi:hypothetical protein
MTSTIVAPDISSSAGPDDSGATGSRDVRLGGQQSYHNPSQTLQQWQTAASQTSPSPFSSSLPAPPHLSSAVNALGSTIDPFSARRSAEIDYNALLADSSPATAPTTIAQSYPTGQDQLQHSADAGVEFKLPNYGQRTSRTQG